jgi:DNA-binding NtrC family response regulator
VRLLRVLETGEYIRVGSSKVQKTDVRIVAATNVNIPEAIKKHRFREDLYYRLNTVPIRMPALRERKEDIHLLFRKFAADFAAKYRMPVIELTPEAVSLLQKYRWPGNIRQLKNVAEQISVIEKNRTIDAETLIKYLPDINDSNLPVLYDENTAEGMSERDLLYKVLFDLKQDVTELKKLVFGIIKTGVNPADLSNNKEMAQSIKHLYLNAPASTSDNFDTVGVSVAPDVIANVKISKPVTPVEEVEESLSLAEKEKELIKKALEKYRGKRKDAAKELGISERTLYRKIKEYNIKA